MKNQKVKIHRLLGLFMLSALFIMSGCKHSLDIKNMDEYSYIRSAPLQTNISIGLMTETKDMYCDVLANSIGDSLSKYSSDVRILNSLSGAKDVEVIADVSITPNYKGSGWNFWINFPGFIVFAPAWNGYIYQVSYDVDVQLIDSVSLKKFDSFDIPIDLDIRHADINRTWTTGMGWLVDYGFTAFVGGYFFMEYDEKVSLLLANELKSTLGSYIAQSILDRVNKSKKLRSLTTFNTSNAPTTLANFKMGY